MKRSQSLPRVICFDVGYTLVDETRSWLAWAARLDVAPDRLFAVLRETIELGDPKPNRRAVERLRPDLDFEHERTAIVGRPGGSIFSVDDLYPDARPALLQLQGAGFRLCAAGNMVADSEDVLRRAGLPLEFVASSERWGVAKPEPEFFRCIIQATHARASDIVYVGDRVDNDVMPARNAGMKTVLIRRGLWADVHTDTTKADASIDALTDLPLVLDRWRSADL